MARSHRTLKKASFGGEVKIIEETYEDGTHDYGVTIFPVDSEWRTYWADSRQDAERMYSVVVKTLSKEVAWPVGFDLGA